jgi:hypothetical protein
MASRNALCVVPSSTIALHRKLGWSKVLTMKMNEKMANASRKPLFAGARTLNFAVRPAPTQKCYERRVGADPRNVPALSAVQRRSSALFGEA